MIAPNGLPKCNASDSLTIEMSCLGDKQLMFQIIDRHSAIHSARCKQKLKWMELYASDSRNGWLGYKLHYLFALAYIPY